MSDIQEQIEKERDQARVICEGEGSSSQECAVAWDTVEELQAEAAHQKSKVPAKSSLEQFCDDNPEAAECRVYDN